MQSTKKTRRWAADNEINLKYNELWQLVSRLKLARADFPRGLSRSSDAASLRSRGIINISMILGEVRCSSNSERQRKREVFLMLPGARSGRLDNLYLEINKWLIDVEK